MEELVDKNPRTRLIKELVEGKSFATQLQSLLQQSIEHYDDGSVSADELVLKIWRSFTQAITELDTLGNSKSLSVQPHSGEQKSNGYSSSELKMKMKMKMKEKQGGKDQRGCYKRRKTSSSWIRESETMDDGCAWRKYGQKNILNSKYPRCYYRCTHKHDQECRATKQVQIMQENPKIMYHTTYFGSHTCNSAKIPKHNSNSKFSHSMLESSPFEVKQKIPSSVTHDSTVKEEEEEEEESKGQSDNVSSTIDSNLWEDYMPSSPSTLATHNSSYYQQVISSDIEDFVQFCDFDEAIEFF